MDSSISSLLAFQPPLYHQSEETKIEPPPLPFSGASPNPGQIKKIPRWSHTETALLKQVADKLLIGKVNLTRGDWNTIKKDYDQLIEQNHPEFPKRTKSSLYDHYRSIIMQTHKSIKKKDLPIIIEKIRQVYAEYGKFSATEVLKNSKDLTDSYTRDQISNLFHSARKSLTKKDPDPSVEDILAKISQNQEMRQKKEASKRSISREFFEFEEASKKMKPFFDDSLSVNIDFHDRPEHLLTKKIDDQISSTSRASSSSLSGFQLPANPPQEEFELESLSDSDEQIPSLSDGPPHADHSFPAEVN